jgi:hypothetical protein
MCGGNVVGGCTWVFVGYEARQMRIFRLWWWRDIRFAIRERWQKATRGYSGTEWYDLRSSAAKYILPRIKHLHEHGHGIICVDYEALGLFSETWSKTTEDKAVQSQNENMGDIIYAMEHLAYEEKYYDEPVDEDRIQRGCELLGKYFQSLWD